MPNRTSASAFIFSTDCLGSVLNHHQSVLISQTHYRIHVRHLSIEVHRNDGTSFLRDLRRDLQRVDVVGYRINVYKYWRRTQTSDCPSSGKERIRGCDDFIPGTYTLGMRHASSASVPDETP